MEFPLAERELMGINAAKSYHRRFLGTFREAVTT
jgi:hypothetical protein